MASYTGILQIGSGGRNRRVCLDALGLVTGASLLPLTWNLSDHWEDLPSVTILNHFK